MDICRHFVLHNFQAHVTHDNSIGHSSKVSYSHRVCIVDCRNSKAINDFLKICDLVQKLLRQIDSSSSTHIHARARADM